MEIVDPFSGAATSWFVYLFALADGEAFKVGFSSHPLQRIFAFNARYYERFDLSQSRLLCVDDSDAAREVEAELKRLLSAHRAVSPDWVSSEAGGHTEWFMMDRFCDAEARLLSHAAVRRLQWLDAREYLVDQLRTVREQFEMWARMQALAIDKAWDEARGGWPAPLALTRSLRNWLDAFRYFEIEVYEHDPATRDFVVATARRTE